MNETTTASSLSEQLKKHRESHQKRHEDLLNKLGKALRSATANALSITARDILKDLETFRASLRSGVRETQDLIEQDQEKALDGLQRLNQSVADLETRLNRLSRRNWLRTPAVLLLVCLATFGMNWAQDEYIDLRYKELKTLEKKIARKQAQLARMPD